MKTSLASALADPTGGQASQISLSSSYQVPATDGRMVLATPLKFCLQFRPPTIAVVYTLEKSSKKHKTSGKPMKYIHSIRVDFEGCMDKSRPQSSPLQPIKPSMKEVEALCKKLCDAEPTYLNINIISKTQVLNLITKLYEKKYGCQPASSPKQVASGSAPGAPGNPLFSAKPKDDDNISDDYDDDFDELEDKKVADKPSVQAKPTTAKDEEDEASDWDLNEDWGELEDLNKDKKGGVGSTSKKAEDGKEDSDNKRLNLFFGGNKDDDDLEDIPELGSNLPNKNEDKFNQVMSSSKEGGGLLASIGLKKEEVNRDESMVEDSQEEDPHKKSDLFDTSKDRIAQKNAQKLGGAQQSDSEELDLGFGSSKKKQEGQASNANRSGAGEFPADADAFENEVAGAMSDEEGMTDEQQKAIDEQFQKIYESDADLRKALEKSDVASFSVVEKYQIIEAYMQGGAAGLQIELEDDEDDEKALMDMTEDEVAVIEAQFAKLYASESELQSAIGSISSLSLLQKYQMLVHYQRAGDSSGMQGHSNDQYFSEDMTEIIEHEGKRYRRVQIEGTDGDHLMDEEANIYTLDFEKIGKAGESDDDDDEI